MKVQEMFRSAIFKALDEFAEVFQIDLDYKDIQTERVSDNEIEIVIDFSKYKSLQMRFVRKSRRVNVHTIYFNSKGMKIHAEDYSINENLDKIFNDIKLQGVEL